MSFGQDAVVMPIAAGYKHIGCHTRADSKYSTDVVTKMAAICKATWKLKRHVLSNKQVAKDTRLAVAHTHAVSCGDVAVGGWTRLTQADQARVNRAVTDTYRIVDGSVRAAPGQTHAVKSDVQVGADLGVMSPDCRLVLARVRLLCHIIIKQKTDLMCLLFESIGVSGSWMATIMTDLEWIAYATPKLKEVVHANLGQWVRFLHTAGKKAIEVVKVALIDHTAAKDISAASGSIPQVPGGVSGDWQCGECGKSFLTKQAWTAHNVRFHNRLRLARSFLRGTTCPVCMRVFGSRSQLLNHVYKKPARGSSSSSSSSGNLICLANILLKLKPLAEAEVEQEDWAQWSAVASMRKKRLSKDYSETFVKQAYGPLRPMLIPLGHSRRSRYPPFKKALKCKETSKEVDFGRLLAVFDAADAVEEIAEDVPLDILAASPGGTWYAVYPAHRP